MFLEICWKETGLRRQHADPIDNWTGTANTQGITGTNDRLIFDSDQSANLSSFNFTGYLPGATEFSLGNGYFELAPVAIPEPATYIPALLTLAVFGFLHRKRLRAFLRVIRRKRPLDGRDAAPPCKLINVL